MNIASLISGNKSATVLVIILLVGTSVLGYLAWNSWDHYSAVLGEYNTKAGQLDHLSKNSIFPSTSNLKKLERTLSLDQENLGKLQSSLRSFRIPAFGTFDKIKPQNQPQYFQDALRSEVTAVKTLAANSSTTLPPSFYLGLDDYENRLPQPEQLSTLSRQLTVLDWLGKTVVGLKNVIVAEFSLVTSREQPSSLQKLSATSGTLPFASLGSARITIRCGQGSFRELINAISTSPYFLVIEDIKVQNSVGEPPLKTAAPPVEQTADGSAPVQRLPIIVGRETLNVLLKIRLIDFPAAGNPINSPK